ncbi:hypothetical protein BJV78DRAFT_1277609 [Lactifluus subvellereus]|nr:hypothetical protein BJV78DRAFT_1277609 [Lactifluus subvellereus]
MSISTSRRRSTVHDLATLRLHPDGTRVPITSPPRVGAYTSRRCNIGRDTCGNRIARDAAGLGVVPKRILVAEDDEGEDILLGNADVSNDETTSLKSRRGQRMKRRRVDIDVGFLRGPVGGALQTGDADVIEEMSWPPPSSDLLKCVHYFTSRYYAARGLLSDRARIYRRKRERRRKARDVQTADADADDLFAEDEADTENFVFAEESCREDIVQDRLASERKGPCPENAPDMYKALDGSALMAIGMLLQEHVSTLLKPNVPPGWEEEMEAAGLAPEDDSIDLEGEIAEDPKSDKSEDEEICSGSVSED